MIRIYCGVCLCLFLFASCATSPTPDEKVDTKLGVMQDEQANDAQKTVASIGEQQEQDQKRQLERQITDTARPL